MKFSKIFFVIDSLEENEDVEKILEYMKEKHSISPEKISTTSQELGSVKNALYIAYLKDSEIRVLLRKSIEKEVSIGVIPNSDSVFANRSYGLSSNYEEAIDDIFNEELETDLDVLLCNDEAVIRKVKVEEMHGFTHTGYVRVPFFRKLKSFFKSLVHIKYKYIKLETSKDQEIATAACGIVIDYLNGTSSTDKDDELSLHNGKLNAFILAPTSLISYYHYLIITLIYQKFSSISLPKSLGFIRSTRLSITSKDELSCTIDDEPFKAKELHLEIKNQCIKLNVGRKLGEFLTDSKEVEEKDSVKVTSLPKEDMSELLISGTVPLFKKAAEEDFRDLFVILRSNALFTNTYFMLMFISGFIATIGLFQNSAPVIIGAMILAPLMSPIISLSMGVIRSDKSIISDSLLTVSLGILITLTISALFTILIPFENITSEISARINPNVLDLIIAILSGVAGAYGVIKEEIAKSLAGVAIAVALIPPLCVTGIGLGLWDLSIAYNSFLLFITNLIGITLASAITFMVFGFSPLKRARKGVFYTTVILSVIAIPLIIAFNSMVHHNSDLSILKNLQEVKISNRVLTLVPKEISVTSNNKTLVEIEVISQDTISKDDYKKIHKIVEDSLQREVILEIVPKIIIK